MRSNRVMQIGLVLASLALIGAILATTRKHAEIQRLTLAAGSSTGESYILSLACKKVIERHYAQIKVDVIETGGTVENLKMLEDNRAQLAVAQADVIAGPSARILAILYDDTFQLLVHKNSQIRHFSDLAGKAIALPASGGQFQSFLKVAAHFGLQATDFHFTGVDDVAADKAFSAHQADAIFRVRALGNPAIENLVKAGDVRFIPIEHAAAMKISHPAFEPTVIPAGAYLGNPAIPLEDLPSISVHRTLLSSATLDDETVRAVTGTLLDWRQEISRAIPDRAAPVRLLLAQIRRPEMPAELGPPLHPGALKFYEKDKPPFILAHADYLGLLLTVFVMMSSWIWQLRAWIEKKQKSVADSYSNRVVALMNQAKDATSRTALEQIRSELLAILVAAVGDLDSDKLSEESFHSFRAILQIGLEVVRDSSTALDTITRQLN